MGKRARVLEPAHVQRLLDHVDGGRHSYRDKVIVLLSFKAGLRAGEIAGLEWGMLLRPDGRLGDHAEVSKSIAKMGSGRRIPLAPKLKWALEQLHRSTGRPRSGPVVRSLRGGHMTPRSIVNWFSKLYRDVGLDGCSSHSGRRTFVTRAARLVWKTGGSLRDVQELSGHRSLVMVQRYIAGDSHSQRKLVRLL